MSNPFIRETSSDVAEGMEVFGMDKRRLGYIRGLRDTEFLLYGPGAPVILVPYTAIKSVSASTVVLQVQGERVTRMGWDVLEATPMPRSSLDL
ncbi:MAG: hypothetical protein ABSC19_07590 [Syntrophorhabdales bacterium]|jgi:hypothetical protein